MTSRRAVLAGALASAVLPPMVNAAQPTTTVQSIGFVVPASGLYIETPTAVFDSFRLPMINCLFWED
jgi:hypothetical protein